jgi:hypothetical protein
MTREAYGNDIRQLTDDELDHVAGGDWVTETVKQVNQIVYPAGPPSKVVGGGFNQALLDVLCLNGVIK